MNQVGTFEVIARPRRPPKRISYSKMWVSSCWMRPWSFSSGMSIGRTIRLRAGSANAPTPSGMKFRMTLFCSNSAWVA